MKGIRFTFEGAAGNTLDFMQALYKDPALRPLMETTILNIKKGELKKATPPYKKTND